MSDSPEFTTLIELPTVRLLEKFGAGSHKPGSGSAAALLSLVACKLLQTVIELTNGREKYAGVSQQLTLSNRDLLADVEPSLNDAFQRDSEQFDRVIQTRVARNREKNEKVRKKLREKHLRELRKATELPLQIIRDSLTVAEHGFTVFDLGFQAARGDSGVAISAALAGASGALSVVYLNLTYFNEGEWARKIRAEAEDLSQSIQDLQLQLFNRLEKLRQESTR